METNCGISSSSPTALTLVSKWVGLKSAGKAFCPVVDKRFCKVTLKVGPNEDEIVANPHFLAFGSRFFNKLMTKDNQSEPVLLPGLEYGAVLLIVSFLHTGYLEIRESNVRSLLMAATSFEIAEVQSSCLEFLSSLKLNLENHWEIRKLANEGGFQALLDKCDEFLFNNLSQVLESGEFVNLEFSEVKRILGMVKLRQHDQDVSSMEVLSAVIKWGNCNIEDKTQYLFPLVSEINLMELLETHTTLELKEAFMGEASPLKNCQSCKILFLEACQAKLELLESSHLLPNPKGQTEIIIVPNSVTSLAFADLTSTTMIKEESNDEDIIKVEHFEPNQVSADEYCFPLVSATVTVAPIQPALAASIRKREHKSKLSGGSKRIKSSGKTEKHLLRKQFKKVVKDVSEHVRKNLIIGEHNEEFSEHEAQKQKPDGVEPLSARVGRSQEVANPFNLSSRSSRPVTTGGVHQPPEFLEAPIFGAPPIFPTRVVIPVPKLASENNCYLFGSAFSARAKLGKRRKEMFLFSKLSSKLRNQPSDLSTGKKTKVAVKFPLGKATNTARMFSRSKTVIPPVSKSRNNKTEEALPPVRRSTRAKLKVPLVKSP